jgi:hypothetical protein
VTSVTDAERQRENRALLRQRFGSTYDRLSLILFEEDPVGINFKTNTDEYEPEVDTILPRLRSCESIEHVRNVVYEEFVHWFGAEQVGELSSFQRIAERVLDEIPEACRSN